MQGSFQSSQMGMHCNERIQQNSLLRQTLADPSWSWTCYLQWLESGWYFSLIGVFNFVWSSWLLGLLYILDWGCCLWWIICYLGSVWLLQRNQCPAWVGLVLYQTQTPHVLPPAVAWQFDFVCSSCVLQFHGCFLWFPFSSHMGKLRLDMQYVLENPSAQYVLSPASLVLGVMLVCVARLVCGSARWYKGLSRVCMCAALRYILLVGRRLHWACSPCK